jgi:hypothetical protein
MTTEMIGRVCDSVRTELENRDLNRYINSILTAYVFRQPPDYEAGLGLLATNSRYGLLSYCPKCGLTKVGGS